MAGLHLANNDDSKVDDLLNLAKRFFYVHYLYTWRIVFYRHSVASCSRTATILNEVKLYKGRTMANAQNMKIISIVLMVVGIALILWGFQMADSVGNQVTESLTGSSTDAVMF